MAEPQIHVPDGLLTMLEGLARSVIKKKPEDIPLFALYYFAKLKEFRKGHPNFNIKKLVKEFHNGTAESLPVDGLEEELEKLGYFKSGPIQTDQFEESLVIPCNVQIIFIPDESEDSGAVSSAFTLPLNQQTFSISKSCTGTRPKIAAGEPLAREDNLTTQKIKERVQNEACAAIVCQTPRMATVGKQTSSRPKSCNVLRADMSIATEALVCSAQCQTSVDSQNNLQVTTDIDGGQCSQNLQSTEASQGIDNTLSTARQGDPVISSQTESSHTEYATQSSSAREQHQSPCLCGSGTCIQPAHPWSLHPCNLLNAWNPGFFDASFCHLNRHPLHCPYWPYHPSYNQPLCYPYYFHHPRYNHCSHSSYRGEGITQKPSEHKQSFCSPRACFPVMPFCQNFPMPSNHCTYSHHFPRVGIPVSPCSTVKTHQMEPIPLRPTPIRMPPGWQAHSMKEHPCMHTRHRCEPSCTLMGQHSRRHSASPTAFPTEPFQNPAMENPNWTAATQHPYSAPHNSGYCCY